MIKEEIVQAISDDKMMPFIQPEQLAEIVDFVIKNYKPTLPSNLDEAAEKWVENNCFDCDCVGENRAWDAFKAGAEWMAGQGETQIIRANADLDPHGTDYGIRSLSIKVEDNIPVGTKFIVQIRKK